MAPPKVLRIVKQPTSHHPSPATPSKGKPAGKSFPPPPAKRAPFRDGVTVAIGPADGGFPPNRWVKNWMTFPLTPGSLPIGVAGLWSDQQLVGGGTRSKFGGPDNDTISFSGQLEPPAAYLPSKTAQAIESYAAGYLTSSGLKSTVGQDNVVMLLNQVGPPSLVDKSLEIDLANNPPARGGASALPPPSANTGVMMMDGATAGFGSFVDPLVFKEILEEVVLSGEFVRIAIGDEYGYNEIVSIRSFLWRYEDPDPDTLYYDLAARSETAQKSLVAMSQSSASKNRTAKHTHHVVKDGQTLRTIASSEGLGADATGVGIIIKLNLHLLGSLWVYPDLRYGKGESAGPKSVLPPNVSTSSGHPYGLQSARHFNADLPLRHGITLTLKSASPTPTSSRKQPVSHH